MCGGVYISLSDSSLDVAGSVLPGPAFPCPPQLARGPSCPCLQPCGPQPLPCAQLASSWAQPSPSGRHRHLTSKPCQSQPGLQWGSKRNQRTTWPENGSEEGGCCGGAGGSKRADEESSATWQPGAYGRQCAWPLVPAESDSFSFSIEALQLNPFCSSPPPHHTTS